MSTAIDLTADRIPLDAVIHDLAIVLRGSLHESAVLGPPARLASRRLAQVLGVDGKQVTARLVEERLREVIVGEPDDIDCGLLDEKG